MVKKISLGILYFVVMTVAFLFFLPKPNLYYALEKELSTYGVIVQNETVVSKPFGLALHHPTIVYRGVESLKAMEIVVGLEFFGANLEVEQARLSSFVKSFLPTRIEYAHVQYRVWNPVEVTIKAKGAFGKVSGTYNLIEKKVSLVLYASKEMEKNYKSSLRQFKKIAKGEYLYETKL